MSDELTDMLRQSLERYTADTYGFEQRWAGLRSAEGFSRKAWQDYAEFGWLALRLPEAMGGFEADAAAVGALMESVGHRLLMEPLLAGPILAAGLIVRQASAAQQEDWLPGLADGTVTYAVAIEESAEPCRFADGKLQGTAIGVLHGHVADRVIVAAEDAAGAAALVLVETTASGVERLAYRLVDNRGAANFRFDGVPAIPLGPAERAATAADTIELVRDEATAALAAEALGVAEALLAATTEYLKIRQQFGRPLATNQALQHRVVELYLYREEIRALARAAERALGGPAAERARIVSGAKAYIAHAARHVGNEAVQLHGGIGVTEELNISHYFRRLMVIAALFGNRDRHFQRFLEAGERHA
jgi:alkylation response protein AidB-like acyl-CoA dehydrogenase